MRRDAKVDANQPEIVEALRAAGAEIQYLHMVGGGCPDLLVAHGGKWYVPEIKDGGKPPSQRRLTPSEKEWHGRFSAHAPVHILETVEDALRMIGVLDEVRDTG